MMKDKVFILNTSRGALVDAEALLAAIKSRKVGAACLDVYEEDFIVDEKARTAVLTQHGIEKAERFFNLENLSDPQNTSIYHHVNTAIKAHGVMKRDVDYVVRDNQIVIVVIGFPDFSGRFAGTVQTALLQKAAHRRIDWVANLLRGRCSGRNSIFFRKTAAYSHITKQDFGSRASADIPVANKKHLDHTKTSLSWGYYTI